MSERYFIIGGVIPSQRARLRQPEPQTLTFEACDQQASILRCDPHFTKFSDCGRHSSCIVYEECLSTIRALVFLIVYDNAVKVPYQDDCLERLLLLLYIQLIL